MADEFVGRVALITGAARGQGRAEALALAARGCNIVLFDLCAQITTVQYALASNDDLRQTEQLVSALGVEALSVVGDVRSINDLNHAVDLAITRFGRMDYLVANAGVWTSAARLHDVEEREWDDIQAINLKGVFNSFRAVLPHMIDAKFGRIVATSSMAARGGFTHAAAYSSAKAGVSSLVKTAALEYANDGITVNAVLPTNVNTAMIRNQPMYQLMSGREMATGGDAERASKLATLEEALPGFGSIMAMPIPWVEPEDVALAVMYLLADSGRFITGIELPVNGGYNCCI